MSKSHFSLYCSSLVQQRINTPLVMITKIEKISESPISKNKNMV